MPEVAPSVTGPSRPAPKKAIQAPRRRRGGLLNVLLLIGIIVTISLFVWAEQQRRAAQQKLSKTATELAELRKSAETSGQEVADEVLKKLRTHISIPTDPAPTVATIVDVVALRAANEFYSPAENGDHLVITDKRAILYDSDRDLILDVVPVQIDPKATPTPTPGPVISPSPTVLSSLAPSANPAQISPTPPPSTPVQ